VLVDFHRAPSLRPEPCNANLSQLVKHHFIDIAPAPFFARLEGFDDRVFGRMKMFGGVFVWRRVAATDVAAGHANPQVQPGATDAQAIFTSLGAGRDFFDLIEMGTFHNRLRIAWLQNRER
jgi:hypothetical protein